eukprot:CAMPEP_0171101768 /NCGR_PEP_ID=MMETSP0766_2-20121228/55934_1 /TAXON_ID=439317 /ORGANISM="Gambierdiscus australes, Strain CAWD 149" /LENGTH=45 /DNA_ID= /DNA_START= /DNA_END= /DNA_ORIENTATION=
MSRWALSTPSSWAEAAEEKRTPRKHKGEGQTQDATHLARRLLLCL